MSTMLTRLLADEALMNVLTRPALFSTIPVTKGNYTPRYNVRIDESDSSAVYEIALPGYVRDDIEVRYSGNRLSVSSSKHDTDQSGYVVHMFSKRPFSMSWSVSESTVSSATMSDGVLKIIMSKNVNDKSDLIPIT